VSVGERVQRGPHWTGRQAAVAFQTLRRDRMGGETGANRQGHGDDGGNLDEQYGEDGGRGQFGTVLCYCTR
jgi:hypothetical protein